MKEHHCTSIVPLFNHLSEEEQDKIESLVIHCHFNKGETVWQPGDEPLLIIVASGSMKVYMIAGNGREQLLRLLTPGSYEGANALLGARAQDLFIDTLDTFFRRHAQVLTCDLSDGQQWQPGDIVVFGDRAHIGLCSDRRNRQGIPFLIHHGNPIDEAVERNDIPRMTVTGHFRWLG